MGGADQRFETTHWTEIFSVRTQDRARHQDAIGSVLARYWKPMYCYLRRKGHDNEGAKDLVQGFCHEVVLGRDLLQHADPERGRFRTYLLTSLSHYAMNVRRDGAALKRAPSGAMFSMDDAAAMNMSELFHEVTPDEAFNRAWASQLLDDVLAVVENECCSGGKEVHWKVFSERTVTPLIENTKPPSLPSLCEKYRISDEAKVSNMIVTVKRRFRSELVKQVRLAVSSDADIEDEIADLIKILSGNGARL